MMNLTFRILALITFLSPTSIGSSVQAYHPLGEEERLTADEQAQLVLRWAPIHYQAVDTRGANSLGGAADYITRYDFDGDLDGRNNWENAGKRAHPLSAHAYYSAVETDTHHYLSYLFFHPRDWSNKFFETEHENDAEGVLLIVSKDSSPLGTLKAAVTIAHLDFFSYLPKGSDWKRGRETVDGSLSLQEYAGHEHPVTAQEAQGHGLKARPHYDIDGRGVIYYPSLITAEVPEHPNDRYVQYKLVNIFEEGGMWDQRNNSSLFAESGSFAGDSGGGCGSGAIICGKNSANAPWGWDDHDDGPRRGALAFDPAGLAANYFSISERHSRRYLSNPYLEAPGNREERDNVHYALRQHEP